MEADSGKIHVKYRFIPMRILAKSNSSVDLVFDVYNNTDRDVLLSFDFGVPKEARIGFDSTTSKKTHTVKMNKIEPFGKGNFFISLYSTSQTPAFEYPIAYRINYHLDNYESVIEQKVNRCYLKVV